MASASSHLATSSNWRNFILEHFPQALSYTYTVPPVHFNRVPYTLDTVPGTSQRALIRGPPQPQASRRKHTLPPTSQPLSSPPPSKYTLPSTSQPVSGPSPPPLPSPPQVMWPQVQQSDPKRVQESDFRDDAAQARVIRNLEELGRQRKELGAMFVLSQYEINNYLNKTQHQAAASQLPRPSQLGANFSHGEFDVLLISRQYGVLIGEIKSVGHNHSELNMSQQDSDAAVVKKVKDSLTQLKRLETVMRHLLSDIAPHLSIRTSLFLPNVSRTQLLRVLAANPQLEQDMCQTLGAADGTTAVHLSCLCDNVSSRDTWWNITPADLSNMTNWWKARMDTKDHAMTDEVFLEIIARFAGPASTISVHSSTQDRRVEVRTHAEAVREVGWRLSQLVFTPPQVQLISQQLPRVFLNGPPGTGKTVLLAMVGVGWLERNVDTYILSTRPSDIAVSFLLKEQIQRTKRPAQTGSLHFRHYNLVNNAASATTALRDLSAAARARAQTGHNIGILVDEIYFNTSDDYGQRLYHLVEQLVQVPGLLLWCAGLYHQYPPPAGLQTEELTTPLRSCPSVRREVRPGLDRATEVHGYRTDDLPAPGDGPEVRRLRHQGVAHTGRWPVDCPQCGRDVATDLLNLHVGVPGSGVEYRDVFVLTRSTDLHEEIKNDVGDVTSQACGFVRGVREKGMPVCVLGAEEWNRDRVSVRKKLEDTATAATDCITAAYWYYVRGLERKVVVWLHGRVQGVDEQHSDEDIDSTDRLCLVSRCTTQLVVVDVPPTAAPPPGPHHHADDETTTTTPTTATPTSPTTTTAATTTTPATPPTTAATTTTTRQRHCRLQ